MNALVFRNGSLLSEEVGPIFFSTLPDDSYVYSCGTKQWYHVRFRNGMPINLSDVPKELRLLQMVMS